MVLYDLADRGKFIDTDAIDLIERYPAFNLSEMLKVIFKDYDLKSNFIGQPWFDDIYLLFTQSNDDVFGGFTGQSITLTIPAALMTCNGGNPDGDIAYLQANNTVTIVTV